MILSPTLQRFLDDPYHHILAIEDGQLVAKVSDLAAEHLLSKEEFSSLISSHDPLVQNIRLKIRLIEFVDPLIEDPSSIKLSKMFEKVLGSEEKMHSLREDILEWVEEKYGEAEYQERIQAARLLLNFFIDNDGPNMDQRDGIVRLKELHLSKVPSSLFEYFIQRANVIEETTGKKQAYPKWILANEVFKQAIIEKKMEEFPTISSEIEAWVEEMRGDEEYALRKEVSLQIKALLTVDKEQSISPGCLYYPECLLQALVDLHPDLDNCYRNNLPRFREEICSNFALSEQIIAYEKSKRRDYQEDCYTCRIEDFNSPIDFFLWIDPSKPLVLPLVEPIRYPKVFIETLTQKIQKVDVKRRIQNLHLYPVLQHQMQEAFFIQEYPAIAEQINAWVSAKEPLSLEFAEKSKLKNELIAFFLQETDYVDFTSVDIRDFPMDVLGRLSDIKQTELDRKVSFYFSAEICADKPIFHHLIRLDLIDIIYEQMIEGFDEFELLVQDPEFSLAKFDREFIMNSPGIDWLLRIDYNLVFKLPNSYFSAEFLERIVEKVPSLILMVDPAMIEDETLSRAKEKILLDPSILFLSTPLELLSSYRDYRIRYEAPEDDLSFNLRKLAQISGLKGEYKGVSLEGGEPVVFIREMAAILNEDKFIHFQRAFIDAIGVSDSPSLTLERYQRDEPIVVVTGYMGNERSIGHGITVVLQNEHFMIVNRGIRVPGQKTMIYHRIDPAKVTLEMLTLMEMAKIATSPKIMHLIIYEIIPTLLASSERLTEEEIFRKELIEEEISSKNQTVDNCSAASIKSAFKAMAFFDCLKKSRQVSFVEKVKEASFLAKQLKDEVSIRLREKAEEKIKDQDPVAHSFYLRSRFKTIKKRLKSVTNEEQMLEIKRFVLEAIASAGSIEIIAPMKEFQDLMGKITEKAELLPVEDQEEVKEILRQMLALLDESCRRAFLTALFPNSKTTADV